MLIEFSLKLVYSAMCGKNFQTNGLTFLQNALNLDIFTLAPAHSKLAPKFLSSRSRQKEITHSPRQQFFKDLFPQ